jgi:DNA-directed RNA polymerase II subunit RPB2
MEELKSKPLDKIGDRYYIGTPTISLKNNTDVRVLFPNEARLRNLTYASNIEVDVVIKVTFARLDQTVSKQESLKNTIVMDPVDKKYEYLGRINLFKVPLMLHSRYCLLNNKSNLFLREVGECPYDYGGYFIVDGSEKVLITRQEQAFNTLYIMKQENNPKVEIYASIQCLNATTRQVKRIAFAFDKRNDVLYVSIPFVRKPLPVFILFRALGVQADNDILRLIFHDENDIETKMLEPYLHETLLESRPFMDQYSAIQYIKLLTKGFSEAHVYDIILNQLFIHVENKPNNKAYFLAECIRRILRVKADIDKETDKDDIRNQRCLTSGFLTKMLFQNIYKNWVKYMSLTIDKEYKYNKSNYSGQNFLNLFLPGNISTLFELNYITDGISRGFKGKWKTGPGS